MQDHSYKFSGVEEVEGRVLINLKENATACGTHALGLLEYQIFCRCMYEVWQASNVLFHVLRLYFLQGNYPTRVRV